MGRPQPPLGATDCERIRDGRIRQPTNTASSALLAVVGGVIALRGRGRDQRRRSTLLGGAVALAGVGSVVFHGPGGRFGHWIHDATIAAMLAFPAADNVREIRSWPDRTALGAYGAAVGASAGLLALRPSWVQELPTILGAVAVVTEPAARRHRPARARRMHLVGDGLWVVAGTAYVLGRTESPLCRPNSWLQLHGLWHILAGAAMAAWAEAALSDPHPGAAVAGVAEARR